ncbi:MAG: lysophospholipid acyltransferase family protein [Planctomycetota bacterium]|nr:lysophospholipid acyltransferase family protein [Planctomycetota bacterium]
MITLRVVWRLASMGTLTLLMGPPLLVGLLAGLFSARARWAIVDCCTYTWATGSCWLLGVRIEIVGTPPKPPFFLVSNHLSYLDIIVLYTRLRGRFLAKAEISGWPMMGWLASLAGTLFIDRSRTRDLSRVLPQVQETLDLGRGVVVFPEGTSTKGEAVQRFKPSIFEVPIRTGVPVSFAALHYRTPAGAPPAHLSVCWWGDVPFAPHFLALLKLTRIDATVAFGDHPVTAEDRKDLALLAQRAVESQFTPVVGCEA